MKQILRTAAASCLLLIGGVAGAQVLNSPHDLTALPGVNPQTGTCVFCHTPHGSDISAPVPLWNKNLPTGGGYTTYAELNTSTLDGGEAANVGSVSLACLSCHDGSQAMDSVINAPGRGTGTSPLGGGTGTLIGAVGNNDLAVIGTDLQDDHPISIQYGGGGITASGHTDGTQFPTGTTVDPDFNGPFKATINTNPAWWVDNDLGTDGVREKTDMILYTRTEGLLANEPEPFVECGSCHDPHNSGTFAANVSVAFLRISNTDSQICTTCHLK